MLRTLQAMAVTITVLSAFWLYHQGYETRRLETQVTSDERTLERLAHDIAVLEAERAYLSRPARIEPLARMLGLRPATPDQLAIAPTATGRP